MNKLVCFSILAISLFYAPSLVKGEEDSIYDAWTLTEVRVSSQVITRGPAKVKAVYLSTTTSGTEYGVNWGILVDTAALVTQANTTLAAITTGQMRSPPLLFPTTGALISSGHNLYKAIEYGREGVFFSSAVTFWKNVENSNFALRAYIEWRK